MSPSGRLVDVVANRTVGDIHVLGLQSLQSASEGERLQWQR